MVYGQTERPKPNMSIFKLGHLLWFERKTMKKQDSARFKLSVFQANFLFSKWT